MGEPDENVTELLEVCRKAGMRRTPALRCFLEVLLLSSKPLTLQQIAAHEAFTVDCDPATLYRLAVRLEEHRIVRQIGFHTRAAHYLLREGHHQDYLICRDCGTVSVLDIACPVESLEEQIASESGFSDIEHELEFYGRCVECQ